MSVMGIDPGLTGGIVVLGEDRKLLAKYPIPSIITTKKMSGGKTKRTSAIDLNGLRKIFEEWADFIDVVYLEKVSAMPNQGVVSVFKFGRVFGILEAMVAAYKMPVVMVTPRTWCKTMHKGVSPDLSPKAKSGVVLGRLFPEIDLRATERSKKPHEGMLDALLIAEYGRKEHYGS